MVNFFKAFGRFMMIPVTAAIFVLLILAAMFSINANITITIIYFFLQGTHSLTHSRLLTYSLTHSRLLTYSLTHAYSLTHYVSATVWFFLGVDLHGAHVRVEFLHAKYDRPVFPLHHPLGGGSQIHGSDPPRQSRGE